MTKGTRIAVECVIDLLARGWTTEQIVHEYDHLTGEDLQACLAYAKRRAQIGTRLPDDALSEILIRVIGNETIF